jgi:hypothetical protein
MKLIQRATMKDLSFGVFDHIGRTSGSPNLERPYQERLRLLKAYDPTRPAAPSTFSPLRLCPSL